MEQTREEMHQKIMEASKRKILRRQMELLTEYSRTSGQDRIPECSEAMIRVHKELVKVDSIYFMCFLIAFFGLFYLMKRVPIKGIKFIK